MDDAVVPCSATTAGDVEARRAMNTGTGDSSNNTARKIGIEWTRQRILIPK